MKRKAATITDAQLGQHGGVGASVPAHAVSDAQFDRETACTLPREQNVETTSATTPAKKLKRVMFGTVQAVSFYHH